MRVRAPLGELVGYPLCISVSTSALERLLFLFWPMRTRSDNLTNVNVTIQVSGVILFKFAADEVTESRWHV